MAGLKTGDRVAWHHGYAPQFAPESIVRAEAVPQLPDDHPDHGSPGSGQFGTIIAAHPTNPAWWSVQLDGEDTPRTLTGDELVVISQPDQPAAPEAAAEADAAEKPAKGLSA